MIRALPSLLILCIPLSFSAPAAEPGEPEIVGVRIGMDGCYKAGLWTPLEVTLRGNLPRAAELDVTVLDGDGVPSRVTAPCPPPGLGTRPCSSTCGRAGSRANSIFSFARPRKWFAERASRRTAISPQPLPRIAR